MGGAALSRERLEEDDSALEAWVDALRPLTPPGGWTCPDWQAAPARSSAGRSTGGSSASAKGGAARTPGDFGDLSRQGFQILLAALERGGRPGKALGRKCLP